MKDETIDKILASIASDILGIKTLAPRHSDALDFHSLAVWKIERALAEAFHSGAEFQRDESERHNIRGEDHE
jgi:hypothetical protein